MRLHIFSVFDTKAKAYLPPFFLPSDEVATRAFRDCVNSNDHQFGKHPEDYTLHRLGTFEDSEGQIQPTELAELVCSGLQCKQPDTI